MLPCLQHLLYSYLFLDTLLDYESVLLVVIYGIFTSHDLESYKHILLPWVCTMKPQGCLSNMPLVLALLKWSLEFCHSWDVHADCPRLPKTWFRILLLSLWRLDPLWTFSRFKLMPTKMQMNHLREILLLLYYRWSMSDFLYHIWTDAVARSRACAKSHSTTLATSSGSAGRPNKRPSWGDSSSVE